MNFLGCGNGVSVPFQATCACPGCGNRVTDTVMCPACANGNCQHD